MSRAIPTAVTIAPRGKAFQVVRLSHVAGPGQTLQFEGRPTLVRSEADKRASGFDHRLSPTVILVDKAAA